jgi:type I restriction enzyme R subunit
MSQGIKEIHFEEHIEAWLTAKDHYRSINPMNYNKQLCLIPSELLAFVKETQPKAYEALEKQYGAQTEQKILENVARNIQRKKTLDVLREGIKDRGQHLFLCFFKPANNKTPEHEIWYDKNRLSIVRQLQYSKRNNNAIDLVIFLNGIPLVTVELKNALTGQNHHNAIKQYMQDRDPKGEPLLEFKRCLVHFAVGTEKVFMCTQLRGKNTFFLPFNEGLENQNPDGFATSFLWEDVLCKDSLLDLIQNFISVQTDSYLEYNPVSRKLEEKKSTKLLFPRYHQRRAVHRLLHQLSIEGTGKNYLIQHSAGSGKSNTITWLAYRLANFYQHYTDKKALFDSVIIVTDRRVLNKQIQENIRQLDKTPGVVAYIDEKTTSQDLKNAIEAKKRIIVTTLQKFPIISNTISHFPDGKYAVLIDEAHSSQSGEASRQMRKALSLEEAQKHEEDELKTLDDIIAEEIERKGQQPNISQFAFTATPKPKTIDLFGTLIDGQKSAFDTYSMEQAIKEGFILDVLKNYMSFKRYYKLVTKSGVGDKEYEKKKTVRLLSNYVDLQDHAIDKKSRIMIEHFVSQTQNEIQGKARAMLVTRSRLHAVKYKLKFDEVMKEMNLPYTALVAFSGSIIDPDTQTEYTESSMNNLEGRIGIPEALKLPKYRLLIVAEKFQTGFDEPLLHTMFVDKKLGGTSTVQTLSRLNRTAKGKNSTMVLDFVNDPELVQQDFQHFYGKNFIKEENLTDPNKLYEVLQKIEDAHVFFQNEVDAFVSIFFKQGDNFEKLQPILNEVAKRFSDQLEAQEQNDFKANIKSFLKLYRFLSQIITFTDVDLEKSYVFLTALLKKLPYSNNQLPVAVLNDVELDSYKIQHQYTTSLELESTDGEDFGQTLGGGRNDDTEYDWLSKIIKTLNDTYGLDLSKEDQVDFERMKMNVLDNEELMAFFNPKNNKDDIRNKFNEEVDAELLNFINTKLDFYNKMTDGKANLLFKSLWFNKLYDEKVNKKRHY